MENFTNMFFVGSLFGNNNLEKTLVLVQFLVLDFVPECLKALHRIKLYLWNL